MINLPTTEKAVSQRGTPVVFTEAAVAQVRRALEAEKQRPEGLRLAVVGGGCAGFQYSMNFDTAPRPGDTEWIEDGFRVFIDRISIGYLEGVQVDWVTSPMGSGFQFGNPNVTTTCGCGMSFA